MIHKGLLGTMMTVGLLLLSSCVVYPLGYPPPETGDASASPAISPSPQTYVWIHYETHTETVTETQPTTQEPRPSPPQEVTVCGPYRPPITVDPPELPILDPGRRDDHEYISSRLIDHVKELRDYIADTEEQYQRQYERYLDECNL